MQNDRNVSSDDNKKAISLDNIIDEYGKGGNAGRNESKLGDAMKKLDEMFNRESEDLAWLDNIMNTGSNASAVAEGVSEKNAEGGNIIMPEAVIAEDGNGNAPDLNNITDDDFLPEGAKGDFASPAATGVIVPDLSVMPGEDEHQAPIETPSPIEIEDDIFANDGDASADDGDVGHEEVLRAENADDTRIFTSSAERVNIPEAPQDYSEWENEVRQEQPTMPPMYDNAGGMNTPEGMQQSYPMDEMLVPMDKKLEKKRIKEEKRLAKAQAKAMKEQQRAQKKAQKNAPVYSYDQGQQMQGIPTDYEQQNVPMQDAPTGYEQQNVPMQDAPTGYEQQNVPVQDASEVMEQQAAPEQIIPENVQTDTAVQNPPVADIGQDASEKIEDAYDDISVEEPEAEEQDDVRVYSGKDHTDTANTDADTSEDIPGDIFRNDVDPVQDQAPVEYTYGENHINDGDTADINASIPEGGAPDFEMFEGAQPEGEYVHNVENAAAQQESNVDSSLGKLFGVDIPDENQGRKGAKKKSEHKKIAKELGAYEEINMADPDAVNNARRHYFTARRRSMAALFGTALFFLISLYAELSMLGVFPLPEVISARANPTAFALVDLQIMCFGAMFVIDSLIGGFYSLLDRRFSPASCALTVFIACAAQAVVSAVFGGNIKIEMFCCVGCLAIFMLALYDSLRASADFKSFNIASSTANKYGAYELGVDSLECSPFASHIDLEKAKVISVNKGSVYEGFVGRNEKRPEGEKNLGKLTLIITLIAVLVGVFVAFFSDGNIKERVYDGITGATIVITSSVPLNIFFISALPKYLAVKKGNRIGATLIGQNASEEYKGLSVVAFEDTEVFLPRDVRISSIKTYGGMALDEAVITMANIYNKIGGPLSKIFAKMVDIKSMRSEVRLVKVYPDAIEVNVDGRDFCLATASYLGANGIRIINDGVDAAFEQSHGSILFMVCSGRVLSKFYIKYSMNPVFEKTLRELHDANLCIGIKTLDPCITNDLVFGCLERANYALSVIKGSSAGDIPVVRNKVNSGVISLGSVHSFLEMLLICEKTGRNVKINNVIKLISAILCIALSTVFVLTNNGSLNIIFCLLIQLFWLLPVAAVSYLNR